MEDICAGVCDGSIDAIKEGVVGVLESVPSGCTSREPRTVKKCKEKRSQEVVEISSDDELGSSSDVLSEDEQDECHLLLRCIDCSQHFEALHEALDHTKEHDGAGEMECVGCDTMFSCMFSLSRHVERKHKEEPGEVFECKTCKKSFLRLRYLNEHIKNEHYEQTSFPCQTCGNNYKSVRTLVSHMRIKHGITKEKRDEGFTSRIARFRKQEHRPTETHVCKECGKRYSASQSLARHMQVHWSSYRFSCDICSQVFKENALLQAHLNKHKGERPYICKLCNKGFYSKGNLLTHKRFCQMNK